MTHLLQTNTKGFDELLFDHRNKAYGAYVLRREYPVNVLKSLLISIAILIGILAIPYLTNLFSHKKVELPPITGTVDPVIFPPPVDDHDVIKPPGGEPPSGGAMNEIVPATTVVVTTDSLPPDEPESPIENQGNGDPNGDPFDGIPGGEGDGVGKGKGFKVGIN